MTILDTGKFLSKLFKETGINIYPVIAENGAKLPFAVYERQSTQHSHKDRQINTAVFEITILSAQYNQSVDLIQKVIDLCRTPYAYEGAMVRLDIETTSEAHNGDDAYMQIITMSITIN
jgi:hypothetical protein